MKKNILKILSALILTISLAGTASAASVILSPSKVNVKAGQTFDVVVSIDPKGEAIYTAKVELDFPANLASVSSFALGSEWMPLTQSGYSLTDNTNGILIKSAGYPGGISTPVVLGTAKFLAKASGSGSMNLTANSLVYNANSSNVLSGSPSPLAFVVSPASTAVPPSNKPIAAGPSQNSQTQTPTPTSSENVSVVLGQADNSQEDFSPATQEPTEPTSTEASSLASIGSFFTLGTGNALVGVITGIVLLLVIYLIIMAIIRNTAKSKSKA